MKRLIKGLVLTSTLLLLSVWVLIPAPQTAFAQGTTSSSATALWTGIFWNNTDFSGSSQLVTYPTGLSQNWGTGSPVDGFGSPVPGIGSNNFSARFTTITPLNAGLLEFVVTANDGFRLILDGSEIIDDLDSTGLSTRSIIVSIPDSRNYTIVVEFIERSDDATIIVNWVTSTGTPEPTATPQPAATGNVVGVRGLAVRSGPFLGASLIAVARPDVTYPILAVNNQEGVFTWYLIQYDEDTVGWASGRYLQVSEPTFNNNFTCNVNQNLALDVIQSFLPDYNDAAQAFACVNAINTGNFNQASTDCGQIVLDGIEAGTMTGLFDILNELNATCARQFDNDSGIDSLPSQGTIFDVVNETRDFDVIGVTRSVMNLRVRPSPRVGRVPQQPQLPWGAQVEILARTVQGGEDFWYQVRYCQEDGDCYVGWILAAFVGIQRQQAVPIDAIPIY